jgi:hypothetical protein
MSRQLEEPILDRGISNTNFFNGRLLTADALKTDQQANRQQRGQLGRAVGDGVVSGLEVRLVSAGTPNTPPVVAVSKGLALSRAGQSLSLPDDDQVALVRRLDAAPPDAGVFADCDAALSTLSSLINGVYVLVIAPASGLKESVPMRGLSDSAGVSRCGSRYAVDGVQFRLVRLDVDAMSHISAATRAQIVSLLSVLSVSNLSKLRNVLAHLCFGTEELGALLREPLKLSGDQSAFASYGALDFLRARGEITDCEVPLALIFWYAGAVRFVDMWAVRRRVTPRATTEHWPPLLDERRASEAEAVMQQFQEQTESLRTQESFPELFIARNYFRYLPSAGLLPLKQGSAKGFSVNTFFSGVAHRVPEFIDGAVLRALLREAVNYEPFDLTSGEMLWLYKVRQNVEVPDGGTAAPPYLAFASPHVPYKATARFDVARWDFSNYTRCED